MRLTWIKLTFHLLLASPFCSETKFTITAVQLGSFNLQFSNNNV